MAKQVIAFHYTLKDKDGATIDSSKGREPLAFLEGAGQIIPGLEKELVLLKPGDKKDINVPCKEGYGEFDEKEIFTVPKSRFPADAELKVGNVFQIGNESDYKIVRVIDVTETDAVLDANHPLAGKDLFFSVEIASARDATPDELAHGHAHGEGGHHHH